MAQDAVNCESNGHVAGKGEVNLPWRGVNGKQVQNMVPLASVEAMGADRADSLPGQNGASTPTDLDPAKVAAFEREPQATRGLFG